MPRRQKLTLTALESNDLGNLEEIDKFVMGFVAFL